MSRMHYNSLKADSFACCSVQIACGHRTLVEGHIASNWKVQDCNCGERTNIKAFALNKCSLQDKSEEEA